MDDTTFNSVHMSRLAPSSEGIQWLWRIGGGLVLLFGLTGNVLALIVLQSTRRKHTWIYFMMSLALADLLHLMTDLLNKWLQYTVWDGRRNMLDTSALSCKGLDWILWSSRAVSALLVVAVCVSVAVDSISPQQKLLLTRGSIVAINVVLWITCFAPTLHFIILVRAYDQDKNECRISRVTKVVQLTRGWLHVFFLSAIPTVILIVCDVILLYSCTRSFISNDRRPHKTAHQDKRTPTNDPNGRPHEMTRLVLMLSLTFIALTFPNTAVGLINDIFWLETWRHTTSFRIVWDICFFMALSNSAVHFYIYLLTSKAIRNRTKALFQSALKGMSRRSSATHSIRAPMPEVRSITSSSEDFSQPPPDPTPSPTDPDVYMNTQRSNPSPPHAPQTETKNAERRSPTSFSDVPKETASDAGEANNQPVVGDATKTDAVLNLEDAEEEENASPVYEVVKMKDAPSTPADHEHENEGLPQSDAGDTHTQVSDHE